MSPRLLIVDDERPFAEALAEFFADRGYEVRAVGSTAEALASIEGFAPDAVISDVRMPGSTGLDLLERLRARAKNPAVVLVTAYGELPEIWRANRLKADGFVRKPLSMEHLASVVEEALARRSAARG